MTNTGRNEATGREGKARRPLSTADLAEAGQRPDESERAEAQDREEARYRAEAQDRAEAREQAEAGERNEARERGEALGGEEVIADNEPTGTFETMPAGARDRRTDARDSRSMTNPASRQGEALEPLFTAERAETYRTQWLAIQSGFVDDPRRAVRDGDELVAQVMANLANTFSEERHRMEAHLDEKGEGSTENLRVALRRYRSFFDRLLAL